MITPYQKSISWSLIAIFGGLMLLGEALHALPGMHFHHHIAFSSNPQSDRCKHHCHHEIDHSSSYDSHCSGSCDSEDNLQCQHSAMVAQTSEFGDDHRCSICDFLGMSTSKPTSLAFDFGEVRLCGEINFDTVDILEELSVLTFPRGPPSLLV